MGANKVKKPVYKRWWFWIIAIIFIVAIVNCGGENEPQKVGEVTPSTHADSHEQAEAPKTQIFKIGDIIQLKDFKVIVNGVRTSDGDGIFKPDDGEQFFYVDCTIENISDKEQVVSSILMLKVVDKDGRSCDQAIVSDANGQLDGNVGSGRKISGEYVVQVPKDETGLELVFDSSLWTGGQVIVSLN